MSAYYNEFDPYAAAWLRNLIKAGHVPAGEVDERSIVDVAPADLAGFQQCHFFAGIGGWSLAARLAGWPDDREMWTGSAPCQPFSVAGQGKAQADDRHLWPHLFRLVSARRPAVLMGEQVAAAVGKDWLDGIATDLEGIGYACGAAVVPACAVDAPHRRDRLWFVADAHGQRLEGRELLPERDDQRPAGARGVADAGSGRRGESCAGEMEQSRGAEAVGAGYGDVADASGERRQQVPGSSHGDESADEGWPAQLHHVIAGHGESRWSGAAWIIGHDGKARRVGTRVRRVVDGLSPGVAGMCAARYAEEVEMIPLLAHGVPARVGKLRAFGNAIVPQVAAEVIGAYLDCRP